MVLPVNKKGNTLQKYMVKVSPKTLPKWKLEKMEIEFQTVLKGIIKQGNHELFLELLTKSERVMIVRRIQIAKRLISNQNFDTIRRDLNVGQATIESVEKWLLERFKDYRSVLPSMVLELREHAKEKRRKRPVYEYSFRWLRRKYPLHFLLFNLFIDDLDWDRDNHKSRKKSPTPYTPKKDRSYKKRT